MLRSAIPTRFQLAWAKNAAGAYIRTVPDASQIGIQDGAASFNDGFVPDNFTPVAAGGVPPFGQDMNGIFNITTTWDQWYQAGAPIPYDSTFATAIGGYPAGAVLASSLVLGAQWYSLVDNNLTNPDDLATAANWARVGVQVGTPTPIISTTVPPGYLLANGNTVGGAESGANYNSDGYIFVYANVWQNFPNLPIFTSAGGVTTRGANPVADFLAGKRMQMPSLRGMGLIGADTMGGGASSNLAGVPVVSGSTTVPGSIVGANLHALITGELAVHAHPNFLTDLGHAHTYQIGQAQNVIQSQNNFPALTSSTGTSTSTNTSNISITNANAGSGQAHNNVQLNMITYWGLKV